MNTVSFSIAEKQAREEIIATIARALGTEDFNDTIDITYPPESSFGAFSVACFIFAKKFNKKPHDIAQTIVEKFEPTELLEHVVATGPYVNFFVKKPEYTKLVLGEINKRKGKYGSATFGKGTRVMVEFFSPNTNKPLTIGHVRNICLGASISALLKFTGHKVITSTLYNDRGIAIAKAILAYQKWAEKSTPTKEKVKPDHFVGKLYAQFSKEAKKDQNLDDEAQRVLQQWESDDQKTYKTWERLTQWVLVGFKQTLQKLGIAEFDESYYESEYYQEGKKVVEQGLARGVFQKGDDGVIFAPLEKYGLPDKVVLRPDDTSLYITQDLHLAYLKDRHHLDQSIYVVGSEQDMYLKQLFKILEMLGFEHAKNYSHLSYGMMRLPDGKIKSREGVTEGTGADSLLEMLEGLARKEIKERFPKLSEKEINKRAEAIAVSALKFYILQVGPKTTMIFDPKKSLAFTGKTGPYLQYTYARISSIFAKEKTKPTTRVDYGLLSEDESFELVKTLAQFPAVVAQSTVKHDPSMLAGYLFELAQQFSGFYEQVPVLKAPDAQKKARLLLLKDVQVVLGTGLELLGITPTEQM